MSKQSDVYNNRQHALISEIMGARVSNEVKDPDSKILERAEPQAFLSDNTSGNVGKPESQDQNVAIIDGANVIIKHKDRHFKNLILVVQQLIKLGFRIIYCVILEYLYNRIDKPLKDFLEQSKVCKIKICMPDDDDDVVALELANENKFSFVVSNDSFSKYRNKEGYEHLKEIIDKRIVGFHIIKSQVLLTEDNYGRNKPYFNEILKAHEEGQTVRNEKQKRQRRKRPDVEICNSLRILSLDSKNSNVFILDIAGFKQDKDLVSWTVKLLRNKYNKCKIFAVITTMMQHKMLEPLRDLLGREQVIVGNQRRPSGSSAPDEKALIVKMAMLFKAAIVSGRDFSNFHETQEAKRLGEFGDKFRITHAAVVTAYGLSDLTCTTDASQVDTVGAALLADNDGSSGGVFGLAEPGNAVVDDDAESGVGSPTGEVDAEDSAGATATASASEAGGADQPLIAL